MSPALGGLHPLVRRAAEPASSTSAPLPPPVRIVGDAVIVHVVPAGLEVDPNGACAWPIRHGSILVHLRGVQLAIAARVEGGLARSMLAAFHTQ